MKGVNGRLKVFIEYLKIEKAVFERNAGLSNGFVDKAGDNIRSKSLELISNAYPQLSIDWLRFGTGEMLKENRQSIGDVTNSTIVGGNVNGNGNKITHYASEYDMCKKEVEHLMAIIAEKDKVIAEKERLITLLLKADK